MTDPEPLMFHAEVVRRDGAPAGYVRAASYGHTLGGAVGLAMIEADVPIDQAWLDAARGRSRSRARVSGARVAAAAVRPRDEARQGLTRMATVGVDH